MPVSPLTFPLLDGGGGGVDHGGREGEGEGDASERWARRTRQSERIYLRRKRRKWTTAAVVALVAMMAVAVAGQDILQNNNYIQDHDSHKFGCGCMEYWTCITR
jgi:hypothetical protein